MISAADAKKLGLKVTEKVEKVEKPSKGFKIEKTNAVENGKKEDKEDKKAGGVKQPAKQPSISKAPSTVGKKGGKDEDVEDDPIAQSLGEREKAGGVT